MTRFFSPFGWDSAACLAGAALLAASAMDCSAASRTLDAKKFFIGTAGTDVVAGSSGDDEYYGEAGDDIVYGYDGSDFLEGGAGNDWLDGGDGQDALQGGGGNDVLLGGAGDDFCLGDDGSDHIEGGAGNDVLEGGAGDDQIIEGSGSDKINGDAGDDLLVYPMSLGSYIISVSSTTVTVRSGADIDTVKGVEHFYFAGRKLDVVCGVRRPHAPGALAVPDCDKADRG